MVPHRSARLAVVLFASFVLASAAVACSSGPETSDPPESSDDIDIVAGKACMYGGAKIKVGSHTPDLDGCNTCTCNKGSDGKAFMACTELACAPKQCPPMACALYCRFGFKTRADGCMTCSCKPTP